MQHQLFVVYKDVDSVGPLKEKKICFLNGYEDKAPMPNVLFKLDPLFACSNLLVFVEDTIKLLSVMFKDLKEIGDWAMPLETFYERFHVGSNLNASLALVRADEVGKFYDHALKYVTRKENQWTEFCTAKYQLGNFNLRPFVRVATAIEQPQDTSMHPLESINNYIHGKENNMAEQTPNTQKTGFDYREMIKLKVANMIMNSKGKIPLGKLSVLQSFAETGHINLDEVVKANYQEQMLQRIENSDGNLDIEEMMYLQMAEEGDFSVKRIYETRMAAAVMKGFSFDLLDDGETKAPAKKPSKPAAKKTPAKKE